MSKANRGNRDAFREMLESVNTPFEECKELLRKSEWRVR